MFGVFIKTLDRVAYIIAGFRHSGNDLLCTHAYVINFITGGNWQDILARPYIIRNPRVFIPEADYSAKSISFACYTLSLIILKICVALPYFVSLNLFSNSPGKRTTVLIFYSLQ